MNIASFNPQDNSGRIIVYPGTTSSDITVTLGSSDPMAAQKVKLTPSTNARTPDSGKLSFVSSFYEFQIFQEFLSINFKLGAAIDTPQGLYYINWSVEETRNEGAQNYTYNRPDKTLIEVTGKKAAIYKFNVDTIDSSLVVGTTSVPIGIRVSNSPASDVTINLTLAGGSNENILINPITLTFLSDDTVKYFEVTISENYSTTSVQSQSITFGLSGSDDYAYSIDANWTF